jgi:hypothetical protein
MGYMSLGMLKDKYLICTIIHIEKKNPYFKSTQMAWQTMPKWGLILFKELGKNVP